MTNTARTWSDEQNAIFGWFETSRTAFGLSQHLVVDALAGTGKTTTIIEGVNRAPEKKIVLCAFNKSIATELQTRISNPNAQAKTLHALGFAIVMRQWPGVRLGDNRAMALSNSVCGFSTPKDVVKLVATLHTKGREIAPHARRLGDLTDLAIEFECVPPEEWAIEGFDLEFVETKALEAMELAATRRPLDNEIDFSDMIFLPVRNHWMSKWADLVVVDEAQDMTLAQLELAEGICKGRICVVGDPNQAIYGFRGADSGSLGRLHAKLGAARLGLRTTYRCGEAIVSEARAFVPDFVAGASNPAGTVRTTSDVKMLEEALNGDFILSRLNAPLVSVCMKLLRNGKRARIAGRDIGRTLVTLTRKLATGDAAKSIPAFIAKVQAWADKEENRLAPQLANEKRQKAAQAKLEALRDQAETLITIAEGAVSVSDLVNRIEALFTDDGLGSAGIITCSSVHKAKGLEANRVFVLRKTIRKGGEEDNIAYVAITRAKEELVWVA